MAAPGSITDPARLQASQATTKSQGPINHPVLRNVTDDRQERQRRELDDERIFLQALLDSLDTGVAACDPTGRLTVCNRALHEIYGLEPGQAGSDPISDSLYGEDGHAPLAADQLPLARASSGETVRGQHIVVRPEGKPSRRFAANAKPINSADGRRLGAVVALHDITEQHHAERLHRAQLAVTRALAEATSAEEAAAEAVVAITTTLGWSCGQYWHVDDRESIVLGSTFSSPEEELSDHAMQALASQVAQRGTELWTDSLQAGSGACIGVPVQSAGRVIGVLTFATGGRALYDDGTAAMLDAACVHLGRFVERRHAEDLTLALAAARRDFARVIDRVNDYVWTVELTPDGGARSIFASPDGSGVFGGVLPTDVDMTAELAARMHADDLAAFTAFHATVRAGQPAEIECRIRGYDDVTRWIWTRAIARRDGDRLFADGISTNITERHELAEQQQASARAARQSERLLAAVAAVSRQVRTGQDARTTIVDAIQQLAGADYVTLLEPDREQLPTELVVTAVIGAPFTGHRIPLDGASLTATAYRSGQQLFVSDIAADERVSPRLSALVDAHSALWHPVIADGKAIAVLTVAWRQRMDVLSDHRTRAVTLLADETAMALIHERLLRRLEQMAHTDTLTGLANRRTWQADLPRLFARARRTGAPLTVAIIDLDHFKRYNDTHGHPAGDDLLRRSSAAFTAALRDGDLIVRWGGEEFAAALIDCSGADAAAVLDRLRSATPDAQTCSIGYATWNGAETTEQLVSRADAALYTAKHNGRNTIRSADRPT